MTRLTQYSESFWGSDFTSTAGFEALSKHNTDSKKFLHDFEDFLQKRSKIEFDYSRALSQLERSMKERTVIGVLDTAWNCLRGELKSCKAAHDDAGFFFKQHAEETRRFSRDITVRRDSVEERVKKIQGQKYSQFKSAVSLNKTYGNKCREHDQCKENYQTLRRGVTSTVKELDRAKTKWEKSEDEATKADFAYKSAVNLLEETRQEWEREMETACQEFQERDEEQISFLRVELWQAVNRVSQTAVEVDESCERVRCVLETCQVDADINSFLAAYSTGTQRPEPVLYQNYYDTGQVSNNSQNSNSSSNGGNQRLGSSGDAAASAPFPPAANNGAAYYSVANNPEDPTYALAGDPTYSMPEPVSDLPQRMLTLIKPFKSADFSLQTGEKVYFKEKVTDSMVRVRTQHALSGIIPIGCIKESI